MNMKMNFSMDEIRLKVEEYIKKGSRAAGRPVLTAYYVLTADSTPESERTNIMIALVVNCVSCRYRRPLGTSLYGREGICCNLCL